MNPALENAARVGQVDAVKRLQPRTRHWKNALYMAAKHNHVNVVEEIYNNLSKGQSGAFAEILEWTAGLDQVEIISWALEVKIKVNNDPGFRLPKLHMASNYARRRGSKVIETLEAALNLEKVFMELQH